jgi:hypothetical protein
LFTFLAETRRHDERRTVVVNSVGLAKIFGVGGPPPE